MNDLIQTLKEQIIDALNLEEITPADIENDVRNRINSILKKRNRD